jgi:hypothetical protein
MQVRDRLKSRDAAFPPCLGNLDIWSGSDGTLKADAISSFIQSCETSH